jgi:hypothetical protein
MYEYVACKRACRDRLDAVNRTESGFEVPFQCL